MQAFVGAVVDGDDRKTVDGESVTMPDMPSTCVEEMRKNGTKCKGYSFSLGNKQQAPAE